MTEVQQEPRLCLQDLKLCGNLNARHGDWLRRLQQSHTMEDYTGVKKVRERPFHTDMERTVT